MKVFHIPLHNLSKGVPYGTVQYRSTIYAKFYTLVVGNHNENEGDSAVTLFQAANSYMLMFIIIKAQRTCNS